ncbi:MAG: autoinducer binding domain-containing protein, partial [Pseudomonadota bacterium]
ELQMFRSKDLQSIFNLTDELNDLGDLLDLLRDLATVLGMRHCSLLLLNDGRSELSKVNLVTTHPEGWLMEYNVKSLEYIDPIKFTASQMKASFFFDEIAKAPISDQYWKVAEKFDIGQSGACFLNTDKYGRKTAMVLSCSESSKFVRDKVGFFYDDINVIFLAFCQAFRELSPKFDSKIDLTEDEERFLSLCVRIGFAHAMSARYQFGSGKTMLKGLLRKFRASSISQVVAVATKIGVLEQVHQHPETSVYFRETADDIYFENAIGLD